MSSNKKKMAICYSVAIFFVALDRFLKMIAIHNFQNGELNLLGDFFKFTFAKNYYIAFSIPLGGALLNLLVFLLVGFLFFYSFIIMKRGEYNLAGLLSITALGASSNLYDRLTYGFVIDYLDLRWFTVFNLADMMIVSSIIIFLLLSFKEYENTRS